MLNRQKESSMEKTDAISALGAIDSVDRIQKQLMDAVSTLIYI
jgi:hypothetical protein